MFDFLNSPCRTGIGNSNAAQNAFQPQPTPVMNQMYKEIIDLQKIVDAMCKVYVAQHAKEIEDRSHMDKFYSDDQPIIDRAKVMELERKIRTAQADLDSLTTEYRSY